MFYGARCRAFQDLHFVEALGHFSCRLVVPQIDLLGVDLFHTYCGALGLEPNFSTECRFEVLSVCSFVGIQRAPFAGAARLLRAVLRNGGNGVVGGEHKRPFPRTNLLIEKIDELS